MNVQLCPKCHPLLERAELDTLGKLAPRLCLTCKGRVAAAALSTKTPLARKLGRAINGAIEIGLAGATIAASVTTAAGVMDETLEQIDALLRGDD